MECYYLYVCVEWNVICVQTHGENMSLIKNRKLGYVDVALLNITADICEGITFLHNTENQYITQ